MSQLLEDAKAFFPISLILGVVAVCTSGTITGVLVLLAVGIGVVALFLRGK